MLYHGKGLLLDNRQEVLEACTGYLVKARCLKVLSEASWYIRSEGFFHFSLCCLTGRSRLALHLVYVTQWVGHSLIFVIVITLILHHLGQTRLGTFRHSIGDLDEHYSTGLFRICSDSRNADLCCWKDTLGSSSLPQS